MFYKYYKNKLSGRRYTGVNSPICKKSDSTTFGREYFSMERIKSTSFPNSDDILCSTESVPRGKFHLKSGSPGGNHILKRGFIEKFTYCAILDVNVGFYKEQMHAGAKTQTCLYIHQ